MLVNIDNEMALNMLVERVKFWSDDEDVINLYEQMYENYVYGGVFDNRDFDIMQIVDNDYVNWCSVIDKEDEAYEDIKKLFDENGCGDISCEDELNHGYSFIEAEYNGCFLVREIFLAKMN